MHCRVDLLNLLNTNAAALFFGIPIIILEEVIEKTKEGPVEHTDRLAKKYLGVDKYPFPTPIEKSHSKDKSRASVPPTAVPIIIE
jgi:hypothetical protein